MRLRQFFAKKRCCGWLISARLHKQNTDNSGIGQTGGGSRFLHEGEQTAQACANA